MAVLTVPAAPARRTRGGGALLRALVRRLPWVLVTIWGVLTIVFFLSRLTGNPVDLLIPPNATPEQVRVTTRDLGLDHSVLVQYGHFVRHALQGDFGQSYIWQQSAIGLVLDRLKATFGLAIVAVLTGIAIAVPLGLVAAFRPRGLIDRVAGAFATVCQSIPVFWLAPLLVLGFAINFHIFPASGYDGWRSWVLPTLSLSLFQVGLLFRIVRAAGLEFLSHDASRLVRAKGARRVRLAIGHVIPNISAPLLTVVGLDLARLLGGSVVVETFFAWPGMGQLLIQSAQNRDYPVIQALVLVFSLSVVIINMTVESLHEAIDPRVRSEA